MYSKTRLGSDQIEGERKLTPRGKRIVYLVLGLVVAACAAVGIWSAVSSDPLATSANGCVSVNIAELHRRPDRALLRRAGQGALPGGLRQRGRRPRSPSRSSATWPG